MSKLVGSADLRVRLEIPARRDGETNEQFIARWRDERNRFEGEIRQLSRKHEGGKVSVSLHE